MLVVRNHPDQFSLWITTLTFLCTILALNTNWFIRFIGLWRHLAVERHENLKQYTTLLRKEIETQIKEKITPLAITGIRLVTQDSTILSSQQTSSSEHNTQSNSDQTKQNAHQISSIKSEVSAKENKTLSRSLSHGDNSTTPSASSQDKTQNSSSSSTSTIHNSQEPAYIASSYFTSSVDTLPQFTPSPIVLALASTERDENVESFAGNAPRFSRHSKSHYYPPTALVKPTLFTPSVSEKFHQGG